MNGELFFQSVMEPVVMFVTPADSSSCAGGNDAVRHKALYPLELLLLLWIFHFYFIWFRIQLPHWCI